MTIPSTLPGWPANTGRLPKIELIGAKANRYLSNPGFSGQVIAVGTRAAYIATDDGNILAACPLDQHPHPRSFLTDLDHSRLQVGLRTWVEGAELRFSNGDSLYIGGRLVWDARPPTTAGVAPVQRLRDRSNELLRAAVEHHEGENLGLAIPFFRMDDVEDHDSARSAGLADGTAPLVAAGVKQVRRVLPLCHSGNLEPVVQTAEQLIGLGPGLTPSGDDFTGGLIFMSVHLKAAYPAERWWKGGDIAGLLTRSEPMTSRISHALLTDLAEGHSHAPLHALVDALISDTPGSEDFDAAEHIHHVTTIGQCSGWDMLTGILAGLLPVILRD